MNKIIKWLLSWGVDRYAHFAIANIIAFLSLTAFCWLPWFACLAISVLVTLVCIIYKDYAIDDTADIIDVIFGIIGGAVIWLNFIITNLI